MRSVRDDVQMMPDLTTTQELHGHDFASATFNALSFRDGLRHVHRASFAASDLTLAKMSLFGTVELSFPSSRPTRRRSSCVRTPRR